MLGCHVQICSNHSTTRRHRLCAEYRLNYLLKSYDRLEDVIPPCLLPVFKPYLKRAERVLQPGVTTHGWTSLVIDDCMLSLVSMTCRYHRHHISSLSSVSSAPIALLHDRRCSRKVKKDRGRYSCAERKRSIHLPFKGHEPVGGSWTLGWSLTSYNASLGSLSYSICSRGHYHPC